ncbi:DEAD/DEAH box helicase family protein [Streptomyces lydicus]|uniref:hypothetical protein n=1 Tax=Streptomyces lydicus TaxID=47763 RepID=UPI0036E7FEB0
MVCALDLPARALLPGRGLRTQVIRATGAGKSLVAVRSAEELHAQRALALVPSLDLLIQTEARGARVAVGARGVRCLLCGAMRWASGARWSSTTSSRRPRLSRSACRVPAAQLRGRDLEFSPQTVWADWLCGKHKPLHRRRVLSELGPCLLGRWLQRQCPAGRHPVPARRRAAGAAGPRLRVSDADGSSQAVPGRPWAAFPAVLTSFAVTGGLVVLAALSRSVGAAFWVRSA